MRLRPTVVFDDNPVTTNITLMLLATVATVAWADPSTHPVLLGDSWLLSTSPALPVSYSKLPNFLSPFATLQKKSQSSQHKAYWSSYLPIYKRMVH